MDWAGVVTTQIIEIGKRVYENKRQDAADERGRKASKRDSQLAAYIDHLAAVDTAEQAGYSLWVRLPHMDLDDPIDGEFLGFPDEPRDTALRRVAETRARCMLFAPDDINERMRCLGSALHQFLDQTGDDKAIALENVQRDLAGLIRQQFAD